MLDVFTLVIVTIIVNLLMGLILFGIYRINRENKSFIFWAMACVSFAVGSLGLGLGHQQVAIAYVLGHCIIGLSHLLIYLGLLSFITPTDTLKNHRLAIAGYLGFVLVSILSHPYLWLLGTLLALFSAFYMGISAHLVGRVNLFTTIPVRTLVLLLGVHSILMLLRAFLYVYEQFYVADLSLLEWERFILVSHILLVITTTMTLPLLAFSKAEQRLKKLADNDDLTGLYNRRAYMRNAHEINQATTTPRQCLSVLILDVDRFKGINDTYGHDVGDQVLIKTASVIRAVFRESDIVARIGGEEFAVIMPFTDNQQAHRVALRVLNDIRDNTIVVGKHSINLTISIGIATSLVGSNTIERLMKKADDALYVAKNNGRDQIICAT